jgi:hypothetical protein
MIDMRDLTLPTIEVIERDFHNSLITTLDLTNMFYAIRVNDNSTKFFNFYVEDSVWTHSALPQGWCASPRYAREAMIETFATPVLEEFKADNNLSDIDFPVEEYDRILKQFVDDLAIFTSRDLPATYKGKLSAVEFHMKAVEAVFYALHKFGW